MCQVCIELIKQSMTVLEAERNLSELGREERDRELATHYQDLHDALHEMELIRIGRLINEGLK